MNDSHRRRISLLAALAGGVLIMLTLCLAVRPRLDPKDFAAWGRRAGARDWSTDADRGRREGQFLVGMGLIRPNLLKMVDRVPYLSRVPLVGRRFFETTSYQIDGSIAPAQLDQAYYWIRKSAEQGYLPAQEALKLFPAHMAAQNSVSQSSPPE